MANFKTESVCMVPVAGCLEKANDFLVKEVMKAVVLGPAGPRGLKDLIKWSALPGNAAQERFVQRVLEPTLAALPFFGAHEFETIASRKVDDINTFLKDRGFTIQLEEFRSPDSFGVAAVLQVLLEWIEEGHKGSVETAHGEFPAAYLEIGVNIGSSSKHEHPVAMIAAKNGDAVYVTKAASGVQGFQQVELAKEIARTFQASNAYEGLAVPMAHLEEKPDISYLVGLKAFFTDYEIAEVAQALQQTELRLNHKGALVKSAAAMEIEAFGCCMPKPPLTIDDTFQIWVNRKGVSDPYFSAVLAPDVWKAPPGTDGETEGAGADAVG